MKSISDKWKKLRLQYYRLKKANNNTDVGTTKFIWYDVIDEILSHTSKANGVSGTMDQGEFVRRIAAEPVNFEHGDEEMVSQPVLDHPIKLYMHLQVLGIKRLVVTLALHMAHVLQILLDLEVKVFFQLQNVQKLIGI